MHPRNRARPVVEVQWTDSRTQVTVGVSTNDGAHILDMAIRVRAVEHAMRNGLAGGRALKRVAVLGALQEHTRVTGNRQLYGTMRNWPRGTAAVPWEDLTKCSTIAAGELWDTRAKAYIKFTKHDAVHRVVRDFVNGLPGLDTAAHDLRDALLGFRSRKRGRPGR